MGWVLDHLAQPNEEVYGLIISPEWDERLDYALKIVPNVKILCYRVDFQLFNPHVKELEARSGD